MNDSKDIFKARQTLAARLQTSNNSVIYAIIKSVDEDKRTCVVTIDEAEYTDVLLYSVAKDNLKGFVMIPKVDSVVLVSRLGGSNELFVSMFSEVDKVILTIEDKITAIIDNAGLILTADKTTLKATTAGLTLTRGSDGLKKTLEALCDAITKLTVTTAMGASGTPINVADFMKIKQDLNNYLEE